MLVLVPLNLPPPAVVAVAFAVDLPFSLDLEGEGLK
jgi:hypothetical protein